jgi:Ala-tRNA(Pro) deacylase
LALSCRTLYHAASLDHAGVAEVTENETRVYDVLEELGIRYRRYEHPAVFTVEEAERYWAGIPGTHCKNLFLRNRKGDVHYLVVLPHSRRADLKGLAASLGEDRLTFASSERLMTNLGLTAGAVSPFGLINDRQRKVRVAVDTDLRQASEVGFHPNVNTATITISFEGFERFLIWCKNPVCYVRGCGGG